VTGQQAETSAFSGFGLGLVVTYVAVAVNSATSLVTVALALRAIGPAGYGVYALMNTVSTLNVIIDFALGLMITRETALTLVSASSDVKHSSAQLAHAVYRRIGMLVAALGILIPGGYGLLRGNWSVVSTIILVSLSVSLQLSLSALYALIAGHRKHWVNGVAAIGGSLTAFLIVVSLLPLLGLPALGLGQLLGTLVSRGVQLYWVRRNVQWWGAARARICWPDVRSLLADAMPLLLVSAGNQIFVVANLLCIGFFAGAAEVGYYRAASTLATQALIILYRGYDLSFPNIVSVPTREGQEHLLGGLTRIAAFAAGIGFSSVVILRHSIVEAVLGDASVHLGVLLSILAVGAMINVPWHGMSMLIIGRRQQGSFARLTVLELCIGLAATVLLSFQFGVLGAAYAQVAAAVLFNGILQPLKARQVVGRNVLRIIYADGFLRSIIGAGIGVALSGLYAGSRTSAFVFAAACALAGAFATAPAVGRSGRDVIRLSVERVLR